MGLGGLRWAEEIMVSVLIKVVLEGLLGGLRWAELIKVAKLYKDILF